MPSPLLSEEDVARALATPDAVQAVASLDIVGLERSTGVASTEPAVQSLLSRVNERARARATLDAHGRAEVFARLRTGPAHPPARPVVPQPLFGNFGQPGPLPLLALSTAVASHAACTR